jgi:hypothetical protein
MTLNVAVLLQEGAKDGPGNSVLILGDRVLDDTGLRAEVKQFANALTSLGV